MNNTKSIPLFGALLLTVTTVFAQPDPKEIVREADKNLRGETSRSHMSMKIERPAWSRSIEMKTWSKGDEYGLILITDPPRDKGTVFLKRGNEMWQWVPYISRTIKIPPSMMMQSWMGSDFTNNDLMQESSVVEDYTHTLLGDTTLRGYDSWVIRMEPKPQAPVVWEKVNVSGFTISALFFRRIILYLFLLRVKMSNLSCCFRNEAARSVIPALWSFLNP